MADEASERGTPRGWTGLAGLAALGVVFGDIGTSPLYTLKTVLDSPAPIPTRRRRSARCR